MSDKFDIAVKIVQELPKEGPVQVSTDDKLLFYGWYKTATVGKVDIPRPGMLAFEGKAKWDAWKAAEDLTADEAKAKYVEKLIEILKGIDDVESKKLLAQLE